jgi:hypothetical protein
MKGASSVATKRSLPTRAGDWSADRGSGVRFGLVSTQHQ